VRDFSRRCNVDVELKIEGDVASLPDKHRTCVYRVIQEAMTNCARHARATTILVEVASRDGQLRVSVSDDGIGLDPATGRRGLGLRGIEERVKELRGSMNIARRAAAGAGTTVSVLLPVPAETTETALARTAG
jgi:signal transduction histidine kinase